MIDNKKYAEKLKKKREDQERKFLEQKKKGLTTFLKIIHQVKQSLILKKIIPGLPKLFHKLKKLVEKNQMISSKSL